MTRQFETISSIVQAPSAFKSRSTPPSGLEGTVDAFYNGIVIIKTRVGEVILRLLDSEPIQSGTKVHLLHEKDSDLVKISATRRTATTSLSSPSNLKNEARVRHLATSIYHQKPTQIDEIKGHHTAAEATLDSAIASSSKENAFDVARSICLIPDMDRDRGMISIMTFLLVSLTRGKSNAWFGGVTANSGETPWDHVMMERIIDGPDTKKWKTRQFPINLYDETLWAIFATPTENIGPVSRFIVEVATSSFGLVQVKAFGQGSTCEIVITSHFGLNDDLKVKCRSAIMTVAEEIDAEIEVSFVSDPMMLANLSQARRTSFEA